MWTFDEPIFATSRLIKFNFGPKAIWAIKAIIDFNY